MPSHCSTVSFLWSRDRGDTVHQKPGISREPSPDYSERLWPWLLTREFLEALPDAALADVASVIRRFHDAVSTFTEFGVHVWSDRGADPVGPNQILCHNDLGPWNLIGGEGRWMARLDEAADSRWRRGRLRRVCRECA